VGDKSRFHCFGQFKAAYPVFVTPWQKDYVQHNEVPSIQTFWRSYRFACFMCSCFDRYSPTQEEITSQLLCICIQVSK